MWRGLAGAVLVLIAGWAIADAPVIAQAQVSEEATMRIRVQSGRLEGRVADGVAAFKGIPYAAPPIGPLRWRAPAPAPAWRGTRQADHMGAVCMQRYNPDDNGVGPLPMSEDCLTLNIWRPEKIATPLPVMVWIHGGGFVNGSGTAALYDGAALARQGVVVVTLNYRLGRLGFFAHPALSGEQAGLPLGNYGFMDQIAALQWVQANIPTFGGDPANVTIFGESAGGMSVLRLMTAPEARGLFQKAIVQSGAGYERDLLLHETNSVGIPSAEVLGQMFAARFGGDLAALRAVPADRILEGPEPVVFNGFGPIIDGRMLNANLLEAFQAAQEARIPLLIGSNSLEMPVRGAQFDQFYRQLMRGRSADDEARLRAAYPDEASFRTNVVSDIIFGAPARGLAALHAAHGAPTFLYRFSVLSASMQGRLEGAVHASERQYVFNTLAASPWPTDANDAARAAEISAYWVAFARSGDPNGEGRPIWPAYDGASDVLMNFTNDGPRPQGTPNAGPLSAISGH